MNPMQNRSDILMAASLARLKSKELINSIFISPPSILNLHSSLRLQRESPRSSVPEQRAEANYATQLPKNLPRQNKSGKNVQLMIKCSHKNCKLSTRTAVFYAAFPSLFFFFAFWCQLELAEVAGAAPAAFVVSPGRAVEGASSKLCELCQPTPPLAKSSHSCGPDSWLTTLTLDPAATWQQAGGEADGRAGITRCRTSSCTLLGA